MAQSPIENDGPVSYNPITGLSYNPNASSAPVPTPAASPTVSYNPFTGLTYNPNATTTTPVIQPVTPPVIPPVDNPPVTPPVDENADWTSKGNQAFYKGIPFSGMRNGLQFINGYRQDMYDPNGKERTTTTTTTILNNNNGVTQSAKDIVNGYLREAGLAALTDETWKQWNAGTSAEQIMDYVRTTKEYATRFPAMAGLRAAGRSITEGQYVAKEQADIDMMTTYGIPSDIATNRNLLGNLIANNVNQVTLQQRLMAGQDSILSQDKNVLDYAKQTFGLTSGDLIAFVLNPDISLPVLQQKAKAIQIGGAAFQEKQAVDANQAMSLAAAGVTAQQAQQGFGNIAQQGQFQQALPGDISGNLTNEELINAQFNMDPVALAKLKKVSATRANEYQGGGQFTASATGVTGIGSAPQV